MQHGTINIRESNRQVVLVSKRTLGSDLDSIISWKSDQTQMPATAFTKSVLKVFYCQYNARHLSTQ